MSTVRELAALLCVLALSPVSVQAAPDETGETKGVCQAGPVARIGTFETMKLPSNHPRTCFLAAMYNL